MSDLPAEAADTDLETEWDKHLPHDGADALIVDVDGFEGPLDVLLALGRAQKVDLRKISILRLTEQYLTFIEKARVLKIELAADYLVMAAWLAYLKSRLLLPPETTDDEPSGEDLAARLAFQLERLAAMRECAAQLMARDQLRRDRFPRGMTEAMTSTRRIEYTAGLIDLMQAYARVRTRDDFRPFVMDRDAVFTVEEALEQLRDKIGYDGSWADLSSYLPPEWRMDPQRRRSATAAHFAAVLELVKSGRAELRQSGTFEPLEIRGRSGR